MLRDPATSCLNLAFLGCGRGTCRHSRTLARIAPGVQRFYASRRRHVARQLMDRCHGAGWFNSYEAALADPRIDVALVATTPLLHLELALHALAAGKDVIVDKPGFLHPDDCTLAALAAARAGRRLLVAENRFYMPLAERLRTLIAEGTLGDVRFLQLNACAPPTGAAGPRHPELSGGGALLEGAIEWIDFLANLGLTITAVHGLRASGSGAPERSALLACEYREGAIGVLTCSSELPFRIRRPRLSRLHGTRGSALFDTDGLFLATLARGPHLSLPRLHVSVLGLRDREGDAAMLRDFLHALDTGTAPRFTLEHARRDVMLARAACAQEAWPIATSVGRLGRPGRAEPESVRV